MLKRQIYHFKLGSNYYINNLQLDQKLNNYFNEKNHEKLDGKIWFTL